MIKFTLIFFFFSNNIYNAQNQRHIFKEYTNIDLNNDKIPDYIQIKEIRCENDSYIGDDYIRCRDVSISLHQEDGNTFFDISNHHIVPCSDCSEDNTDPFKELKIRKNSLSFILTYKLVPEGTKITYIITFKYDKILNNFILHKKITTTESSKNGEIENKRKVETAKDFGTIYFSDYR